MSGLEPVEEWRPVVGFEGRYEVSAHGRVRSIARRGTRGVLLAVQKDKKGYPFITLGREGRKFGRRVHRLVCEAFHGPCPPGHECAHLDGNPSNCLVRNLAWVTPRENREHRKAHGTWFYGEKHPNAALTDAEALEVMALRGAVSATELAARYGVLHSSIRRVWRGERYSHLVRGEAA